ncbi:hypothetical protein [Mycolicibacterium arenosum]|uniref:Uncharacterized protein n=1 Tax=Mycolicibacterium arenosum TaxID=2952157 RepID=A0ABT1LX36_9MYCO|nr:hypothetical protein [Mycolicibacterium sp. CAU 1645]MCP9271072.1 hypothetical protein [Mycolicibacterium sp. CAU 1645]
MKGKNLKLVAATAGTAGLLAMGAIGASFSAMAEEEPPTPGPVAPPEVTTGETTTDQTVPPTTPTTSIAVPEIEGPAPLAPEQEDAM